MTNNVLTMKPITTKEYACAPETPMDIWLPYEQRISERYVCESDGTVYERFQEIAVIFENEGDPDGDLETEMLKLPDNLVAWEPHGSLGIGATIRVKGCDGSIIFEEKIIDEMRLGRLRYYVTEKQAPLLADSYSKLENELRFADSFWNRDPKHLAEDSAVGQVVLKTNVRGSIFLVTLQQMVVQQPFGAYSQARGGNDYREFWPGDKVTKATASIGGKQMVTYIVACPLVEAVEKLQSALKLGYN